MEKRQSVGAHRGADERGGHPEACGVIDEAGVLETLVELLKVPLDRAEAETVGRFGSAELRGVGGAADVRGSEGGRASPCGWLASPSVMSASV